MRAVRRVRAGYDRDERGVAPERAPRRGDDARRASAAVAALGLGRFDCRGGFGDRRLGPGADQRVTGGTAAISPITPARPPGERSRLCRGVRRTQPRQAPSCTCSCGCGVPGALFQATTLV
jgi:hypothetical protein